VLTIGGVNTAPRNNPGTVVRVGGAVAAARGEKEKMN
jgi:hypothetical protein